ncbi:hypothetical protein OH492_04765 [Vibrio chagasii]|nr:hypothetical protein [Vibrio chagasii]
MLRSGLRSVTRLELRVVEAAFASPAIAGLSCWHGHNLLLLHYKTCVYVGVNWLAKLALSTDFRDWYRLLYVRLWLNDGGIAQRFCYSQYGDQLMIGAYAILGYIADGLLPPAEGISWRYATIGELQPWRILSEYSQLLKIYVSGSV